MTPEQFWDGNPWLCRDYRKAHKIREEREDSHAWNYGYYVYIGVCSALSNAFSDGKNRNTVQYPKQPLYMDERERRAEIKRLKETGTNNATRLAAERAKAWAIRFNEEFDKRKQRGG